MSRRTDAMEAEHREVLARIRGDVVPSGQCDGCPAGTSYLCRSCGLCQQHCNSHGCGHSPHASEAYDRDDSNC